VKDVKDVCAATGAAVVDEVISRGKTKETGCVVRNTLAATGIFAEEPETFGNAINYFFCDSQADARCPINEHFVEVPVSSL
jgi:hypothetical protein